VSCSVTGPGFSGILIKGKTANLTGVGTVTLKCNSQIYMRCDGTRGYPASVAVTASKSFERKQGNRRRLEKNPISGLAIGTSKRGFHATH
jgi:hypothetical protein